MHVHTWLLWTFLSFSIFIAESWHRVHSLCWTAGCIELKKMRSLSERSQTRLQEDAERFQFSVYLCLDGQHVSCVSLLQSGLSPFGISFYMSQNEATYPLSYSRKTQARIIETSTKMSSFGGTGVPYKAGYICTCLLISCF